MPININKTMRNSYQSSTFVMFWFNANWTIYSTHLKLEFFPRFKQFDSRGIFRVNIIFVLYSRISYFIQLWQSSFKIPLMLFIFHEYIQQSKKYEIFFYWWEPIIKLSCVYPRFVFFLLFWSACVPGILNLPRFCRGSRTLANPLKLPNEPEPPIELPLRSSLNESYPSRYELS